MLNLGLGIRERWRLRRAAADLEQARAYFRVAMTDATKPQTALNAGIDLASLERDADNWPGAHIAYQGALSAAETLLESNTARDAREVWIYESRGMGPRGAYAAARCGDMQAAVHAIERSRGILWTLALRPHVNGSVLDPRTSESQAEVVDIPIVYLAAADEGGVALIVTPAGAAPTINTCWLPDLTDKALRERLRGPDAAESLGGYLGAYAAWQTTASDDAADDWASTLDDLLRWSWTVAIGPVLNVLPPAIDRIVVIAAGPLGVIPLHAAWIEDATQPTGRRYALDRVAFTYAANAAAFSAAQHAASVEAVDDLFAVENPLTTPDLDLPTAAYEVAAARRSFPSATVLRGAEADSGHVVEALTKASVVHLCCHGRAEMDDPLASAMQLANGTQLTLAAILPLQLTRCRLVLLSACETALAGTRLPDEIVSLQSALLQAGATTAIATSWSILRHECRIGRRTVLRRMARPAVTRPGAGAETGATMATRFNQPREARLADERCGDASARRRPARRA